MTQKNKNGSSKTPAPNSMSAVRHKRSSPPNSGFPEMRVKSAPAWSALLEVIEQAKKANK